MFLFEADIARQSLCRAAKVVRRSSRRSDKTAEGFEGDPNDLGVMAGALNGEPAIAWFDETNTLQTTQLGLFDGDTAGYATAINNLGEVVGTSKALYYQQGFPMWDDHGFIWTATDGMTSLGSLGRGISFPTDINDHSQVVGESNSQAFVWDTGVMTRLSDLIPSNSGWWKLLEATAINNNGQIAGFGRFGTRKASESHGFLLTPKP